MKYTLVGAPTRRAEGELANDAVNYMIVDPPVGYICLLGQDLAGRLGVFCFGSFAHFLSRRLCDYKWILIGILSRSTRPFSTNT